MALITTTIDVHNRLTKAKTKKTINKPTAINTVSKTAIRTMATNDKYKKYLFGDNTPYPEAIPALFLHNAKLSHHSDLI